MPCVLLRYTPSTTCSSLSITRDSTQPGNESKQQIKLDQGGERDRHILALLEELKSGPRHLERLVIKNGGRVFFLNVDDVHCIESEGNYVRVYDNQKGYLLRETISSLEEQLDPRQFRRIHRSAIVKIDKIKEMQPWFHGEYRIIMENGKQLTLSRNYRGEFPGRRGEQYLSENRSRGRSMQRGASHFRACSCLSLLSFRAFIVNAASSQILAVPSQSKSILLQEFEMIHR